MKMKIEIEFERIFISQRPSPQKRASQRQQFVASRALLFVGMLIAIAATHTTAATAGNSAAISISASTNRNVTIPVSSSGSATNGTSDANNSSYGGDSGNNVDGECEMPENSNTLTQTQLISQLTAPCRYDRLEPPTSACRRYNFLNNNTYTNNYNSSSGGGGGNATCQVDVSARVYIYVLQNVGTSDLKFHLQGLMQVRFVDPRLAYAAYAPRRTQPIMGEGQLRELIWVPHIFLANEHDSSVLGTSEKDVLVSIAPDGTVIISSRIQATLYCFMNLRKFPFDEQMCTTVIESWMYNATEMMLHWERNHPVSFDPSMHLTEYDLQNAWSNESLVVAQDGDLRHGAFVGNYSSLSFTVHLTRQTGYYVMDYFLPSMMIVAISWVSFWLQADQTPARTTLGTSTLLSFITLASSQENNLPKVSYIKVSEVWFLGCTIFIFGSLIEFAFVNTIWRRSRSLEVKKVNSKYIFKSTLTPSMHRRKMGGVLGDSGSNMKTSHSSSNFLAIEQPPIIVTDMSGGGGGGAGAGGGGGLNSHTIIHISPPDDGDSSSNSSSTTTADSSSQNGDGDGNGNGDSNTKDGKKAKKHSLFTMTPHEVALWIDRKARFVFPLAFLVFNAIFWTFVYCL